MKIVKKLKERDCKGCGNKFQPSRYFQVVCSAACAIKLAKEKSEKKRKAEEAKENKAWKIRKKEGKEKLKTLSDYESEARRVFQKFIRMRDIAEPCISCGTEDSKIWDGSHLFKAEIYSGLIFNEMNVHKACRKCNYFLGGNEAGYKDGLIKRYGKEYLEALESIKDEKRNYSWTREELIEIKRIYNQKLKEL